MVGIAFILRRIECIHFVGGCRSVDERLAHVSDRGFERALGRAQVGGIWVAHTRFSSFDRYLLKSRRLIAPDDILVCPLMRAPFSSVLGGSSWRRKRVRRQ